MTSKNKNKKLIFMIFLNKLKNSVKISSKMKNKAAYYKVQTEKNLNVKILLLKVNKKRLNLFKKISKIYKKMKKKKKIKTRKMQVKKHLLFWEN